MVEADVGLFHQFGEEGEFLVVFGGGAVLHVDLDDDEEDAGPFELGVGVSLGPEEFDAAHFEVLEVAGVVEVAHGVDLGVADADGQGVLHGGKPGG